MTYGKTWFFAPVLAIALFAGGCLRRPVPVVPGVPAPVSGKKVPAATDQNPVGPAAGRTLLVIERNTNANVVHYDAGLSADGSLNPAEPVIVYWVLLAEDGRRKKLNWLEKKKAYGVKLKPAADGYTMTLAAAPWMPLAVKRAGGGVRLEAPINGRPAVMRKMFIQSRAGLLGPKVEYIDLYGKDLATGEPCRERIRPK